MSSPSAGTRPVLLLLLLVMAATGATPAAATAPGNGPGLPGALESFSRAPGHGPAAPSGVEAPVRHTELERSSPSEGAVVEGPPDGVLLRFTTPIQLPLSRVALAAADGVQVTGTLDMVDASQGQELRFAPASPLDPGRYRVEWQTAGPDSHVIRGAFAFQVAGEGRQDPVEGAAAPGQVVDTLPRAAGDDSLAMVGEVAPPPGSGSTTHVIRWLQYLGMILVLGGVAFRFFVVPFVLRRRELAPAGGLMLKRLAMLAWVGIALLALSLPARLWSQSLAMWGGDSLAAANLGTLVFRTPWGWGWLLQIGALILTGLGLRLAAPAGGRKRGWGVVAVGSVLLAFVPALSGHAWGIEPRLVGVLFSGAHVLGAGVWMGGLAALLLAGLPGVRGVQTPEGERSALVTVVEAFSRMALVAVLASLPLGILVAYALARWTFPGKQVLNGLVHLPLILPPVVTGYLLLLVFGTRGPVGGLLAEWGIVVAFRWTGAALAAAIMAFPLVVRAIRLSIEAIDPGLEQAGATLGARPWQVFVTVTLPMALPGIIAGAILGFAKAMGEFGATITFVSNIPGQTRTIPSAIHAFLQVPGGEAAAMRLVVVSIVVAMGALIASELLARRVASRVGGG